MSGPKKADVVAALNVARNTQRNCATLISRSETAAVRSVLAQAETALASAASDADAARRDADAVRGEAGDLVGAADAAAQRAGHAVAGARRAAADAASALSEAGRREASARAVFEQAEGEYGRANAAVQAAGSHYLNREMGWARKAQELYDRAAAELRSAEKARREAEAAAAGALRVAGEARAAAAAAREEVRRAAAEAHARRRAEEEARRIAEEGRRRATLALEGARAAAAALGELPHARFAPGAADAVERALAEAGPLLGDGRFDEAVAAAGRARAEARDAAARVAALAAENARRRADAEARVGVLAAGVESADPALLEAWAPDPGAGAGARAALRDAREALEREDFDAAGTVADQAAQGLAAAVRAAAEAQSLDERRALLGEAIMDTLEELGFEVSYEPGTRSDPLRISGQTPDATGRGDFDLALPLEGDVDFRVEAAEGDVACVAAIEALRQRLADRGVAWSTTDWGHAAGHAPAAVTKRETEVLQQKTRQKA